ncbi:uncharacterized protein LOC130931338 [Corythoichthys intestinalis]|uniref:uncharacterized protein LOC130931338 n=1 Tax=Corythoichthys intestinalis TaxID=161448 RepID=UPI0025A595C6|nr:uncharacterized protein LOC130931338 [Corythoichthys intestinalis]
MYLLQRAASSAIVKLPGLCGVKVQCVEDCSSQRDKKGKTKSVLPVRFCGKERSVRGSFHQGDSRFEYGGVQCMAISLVAVAKHTTHSVLSWQSGDLDEVVTLGDELYSFLRKNNKISGGSEFLCVPDLPKQQVINGKSLEFEFGDFVTGDVNVVSGELVDAGVLTPLKDGLAQICGKYDTCFMTLNSNTCAIIKQNGMYAVVDSHARNADGMVDGNGFSVVVVYRCLDVVWEHFVKCANMMNKRENLFEIAGVRVISTTPSVNSPLVFGSSVTHNEKGTSSTIDLPEDVYISNVTEKEQQFLPLRENVAQLLCRQLNIEFEKVDALSTEVGLLGKPCKNEKVVDDGNSLFRAVSQAVSGTQKYHRKIRLAVVKQIERNAVLYKGLLRSEYSSVAEYLTKARMRYVGSWTTEVEIQAAADCLEMSIFIYHHDRWIEYSCSARQCFNQALYLEYVNGKHYENVTCVHMPQTQKCYGYCVVYRTLSGYNIRRQSTAERSVVDSKCLSSVVNSVRVIPTVPWDNSTVLFGSSVKQTEQRALSCNDVPDVVFVSDLREKEQEFHPLRENVAQVLCKELSIELEKGDAMSTQVGLLGKPCKNEKVVDDGNCFFRAVSQAVSGTQKYHRKIRLAVVKQIERNIVLYQSLLRSEYSSVGEYLSTSKMHYVGSWATEVEIQAAADFLRMSIFTYYQDRWIEYTCSGKQLCNEALYLENVNGNHYENVVCVHLPHTQKCYGYCEVHTSASGYNMRRQSMGESSVVDSKGVTLVVSSEVDVEGVDRGTRSDGVCLSSYLKSKYKKHKRINYQEDVLLKQKCSKKNKMSYLLNQDSVQTKNKNKYHVDRIYQEKQKERSNARVIRKYKEDVLHREDVQKRSIRKYKEDVLHREDVQKRSIRKYKEDVLHREDVQKRSIRKYKEDVLHREDVQKRSIRKYKEDVLHREDVQKRSIRKYKGNVFHREDVQKRSIRKYNKDVLHREKVKKMSKSKYKSQLLHRQNVKAYSKAKYKGSLEHRKRVGDANRLKRQEKKEKSKQLEFVMKGFLEKVKDGPEFVCCVCQRLLFKNQVLGGKVDDYLKRKAFASVVQKCISEKYLHKCSGKCEVACKYIETGRGELRICYSCHSKMNKGEVPPESIMNNLELEPIPAELACLNSLEQHLIALHIPFMKMLALPKGGQNGVHGPVTCVPANIVQTDNLLPRSQMEGSLIGVKLKRKLTYKGHYEYKFVDSVRVRHALQYLKHNNKYYKDIEFNKEWVNTLCKETEVKTAGDEGDGRLESEEASSDLVEDELLHDRQQHCMFQDTCLMPVDIGQEVLDQYVDNVLNVAPGEGNNPVKLLSDMTNEAKCFPVLFPRGMNTFHECRHQRLTLARYFNNRILHADGRFARNVEYIFYAQYMSELQQVISNVSIALRKGKGRSDFQRVDVNIVNDDAFFQNLLEFDNGYRFLKPIRGTPAFWQAAQSDLLACVRQLGIPTWFCSFSSADMRWQNLLGSILMQEGRTETLEQLEWAERCELLRDNPVTAARMFDFRWHCFLREVLMSPAEPIGKIKDYFYRIEFQQRGSPHVHCLFWIENAPMIDKNTDEEVVAFIDKYVTCELPTDDKELFDIVTSVQQHSKRHSKTCRKKNTVCRFNFPRPPSCRTFICHDKRVEKKEMCRCDMKKIDEKTPCECKKDKVSKDKAATILGSVKKALSDETKMFESVEHLFQSVGVSQKGFEEAYKSCARGTQIVMKRQMKEVWINQYSKALLKCWNANMDIQFVADAYACVVYIISYISKAEREMGLLLGNAQREAAGGNVSAKEALKNLGSVYLHNRDVCAQEAVYRLTPNLHLKECSRKVVFVPTGENVVKMSLPLSVLKKKAASHDLTSQNMWMTSLVDRYKNRPDDAVFTDMCLATFVSEYRILSKNEKSQIQIRLKNDGGFVTKRNRTQPAVVRYMRVSETKNPEIFYRSIMQLFLPYRADVELKPSKCETFEQFYKNGQVRFFDGSRHTVKLVVDSNRSKFEFEAEKLDDIQNSIENNGALEDAWCELCPEQELERLETLQMRTEEEHPDVEHVECIPDLAVNYGQVSYLEKRNILSRKEGMALIRCLNDTQRCIFYHIRQWCIQTVLGEKPAPLHVFITGGAGTGKSHLIKAIQYEATILLCTICTQPDSLCVLLTAPTGIAAFNIQASTIHTTFHIGKDVRLPYTPLGEEKLNSLRAKYKDLKMLIIDEISMVDHRLLTYIHGRLRQIKQTGDFAPFGNVSVLAVGDFYQLSPVQGKPLYVTDAGVNLWSNLFKVVELNTVVRQQDQLFAELLNRIRTRSKGSPMLVSDIESLKHCESGEDSSALHIFATNKQVNEHNIQVLLKTCPEYVKIEAQDFVHNKKTGRLELISGHHAKVYKTCLEDSLLLGINARVMLCKNVDVVDGLVNGVCGTVTHIVSSENKFPQRVYVKFDKDEVGSQRRKQSSTASVDLRTSTYIEPEEEKVTNKGGLRRQFPLKLAWACTVHKVQGLTVDSAVVSLKKIFSAGQAYVALSRVRTVSGLIIQDFAEERIYCKDNIKEAIQRMAPLFVEPAPSQPHSFSVFLMNVQGLTEHVADLSMCTQHLQPNCLAVTETWLPDLPASESIKIDGYSFHSCPRSSSYSGNNSVSKKLQSQQHGGVGVFSANNVTFSIIEVPHFNLECAVSKYVHHDILVAVIYRPPSYPLCLFKEHLSKLLDWLDPQCNTIAVMGDFNEDILKSSSVCKCVEDRGYVQLVTEATTERGTLIDHVYVKTTRYEVESSVVPTYFGDHEGIVCHFRDKKEKK